MKVGRNPEKNKPISLQLIESPLPLHVLRAAGSDGPMRDGKNKVKVWEPVGDPRWPWLSSGAGAAPAVLEHHLLWLLVLGNVCGALVL